MKTKTLQALVAAAVLAGAAAAQDDRPKRRVADPALQRKINKAIDKGVAHLKKVQRPDGSWLYGPSPMNPHGPGNVRDGTGGLTALALYALAASGVSADDPAVRRGVRWVRAKSQPFDTSGRFGTYSASLLVLALSRIDVQKHRRHIRKLAQRIARAQHPKTGFWSYYLRPGGGAGPKGGSPLSCGDTSNTQFAVLALWAAETLAGYKVPKKTWVRIRDLFVRIQAPYGGWPYAVVPEGGPPGMGPGMGQPSPSMTAAGLVSYVYGVAALKGGVSHLPAARKQAVAQKGLRVFMNPMGWDFRNYYFVYSLERVGTVLGVPSAKWYDQGAKALVSQQSPDGAWTPAARGAFADKSAVYETSLALLFLSRATSYVITPRDRGMDK